MTAITFGSVRRLDDSARRIPLAPAEGWTTLGLVLLLCLTLAWSIDDANWVIGPRGLTDFLAWTVSLGAVWGFISAKVGWSRWLSHLLGAVFAALLVPMIVGARLTDGGPVAWYQATAASVVDAYFDLTLRGLPFTVQVGHFMLTLGLVAWATGQFTGYATFRHRRPLNGVVVVGIGLVANMSLTLRDQLPYLVIYSLAALFLLIRFHAYDERTLWVRHRIGDAASLGGLYLRGGTLFVASAVVLSLFLTASASSAPLASMWRGADQTLVQLGREFQRVFRGGGSGTRINVVDFSGSAVISGIWTTDDSPVLDITVPDSGTYYWRATTYDRFDGKSWTWSRPAGQDIAAGAAVLGGSVDDPAGLLSRQARTFTVKELGFDPQTVFAPDAPIQVDVPSRLETIDQPVNSTGGPPGVDAYFAGLTADAPSYTVKALVPIPFQQDPINGLTENRLKVAGTDYPASVKALYLAYDPNLIGPQTKALLAAILVRHPEATKDPYDLARAITTYLIAEGGFTYNANVTGIDCGSDLVVECFAKTRQGYCEYYASEMAMLLRFSGVPARLAEGFLPGRRTVTADGTVERILKNQSHAWVEVYFPGYGWIQFDPTGGPQAHDVPLPAGPVVSAKPVSPRPTNRNREPVGENGSGGPRSPGQSGVGGAGTTGSGGAGSGPFVVIGALLAIAMAGLVFLAYRRGPRTASEPDAAWRGVVGIARRFGFAPRPSQTVFEYSSALGDILPGARPDLQIVARAKVEVAYGRTALGPDRMRALRDAQRRLRVALLGLVFRRRERRERRLRGRGR